MSFTRFSASFIAALVLAVPFAAFAQTERGTITGVVMDSSKAAVPGASIAVINTGTNAASNVVSSESGTYSATNLPPGTYRIEATLQGFQTSKVEGVILNAGTTARVDVTLSLGSVSESVLVVAENAVVQTEDAKVATTVSNRLIDELPLVVGGAMRSPFDLLSTVPEARGSGNTTSLGGGQGGSFGATLDGISVNTNRQGDTVETAFLTPSLEAITEFQVETNGFKPEFGQAGGGSITFASKSGTNSYSGSGYGFFRARRTRQEGIFRGDQGHLQAERRRRVVRRAAVDSESVQRAEPHLLLRVVRRVLQQAGQQRRVPQRADAGDVGRRFLELGERQRPAHHDLRSGDARGLVRTACSSAIRSRTTRFRWSGSATTAKEYIALARSVLVPNQGAAPGTFGYVNNNYVSEGRSTIETTNKYSLKIDHTLSNTNRVAYVFNRTNKRPRAWPERRDRAAGAVQRFSDGRLRRRSCTARAGTGSARAW